MIREKKLDQLLKKRKDDEAWISFLKIKAENFGRRKKLVQVFFFSCTDEGVYILLVANPCDARNIFHFA